MFGVKFQETMNYGTAVSTWLWVRKDALDRKMVGVIKSVSTFEMSIIKTLLSASSHCTVKHPFPRSHPIVSESGRRVFRTMKREKQREGTVSALEEANGIMNGYIGV